MPMLPYLACCLYKNQALTSSLLHVSTYLAISKSITVLALKSYYCVAYIHRGLRLLYCLATKQLRLLKSFGAATVYTVHLCSFY